jgi:hypothetical protein
MKRAVICFLFFSLSFISFSQITLTTGEVFNFSPGDEFLIREKITTLFPNQLRYYNYIRNTILSSSYSVSLDTVFYEWRTDKQIEEYYYPGGGPPTSTVSNQTYITNNSFTNLSSSTEDYASNNYYFFSYANGCYADSVDTLFFSIPYCNKKSWYKEYVGSSTCFEPANPILELTEGCGQSYLKYYDYAVGQEIIQELIYYKKGTDSCGINLSVATRISDQGKFNHFTIAPVPSAGIFKIDLDNSADFYLEVFDIGGKCVFKSEKTANDHCILNLCERKSGVYFIKITTAKEVWRTKVIKE